MPHIDCAKIGPNAVIQLAAALRTAGGENLCVEVFAAAGVSSWLLSPPEGMIDQAPAARLHRTVRAFASAAGMAGILTEAGRLTADYLLANRIPPPAQTILRHLPDRIAARALAAAIRSHAWTFAGSGRFAVRVGLPTVFEIAGNPLCAGEQAAAPVCAWHAAVFGRLFRALVSDRTRVTEDACSASGDAVCRFVVDWRPERCPHRSL